MEHSILPVSNHAVIKPCSIFVMTGEIHGHKRGILGLMFTYMAENLDTVGHCVTEGHTRAAGQMHAHRSQLCRPKSSH